MTAAKKRVAIIGAGASGLPSIRHALLYNCEPVCFESSEGVGGLWRYKPHETNESSVMKSTVINTSKEMTAYSDYPPPAEFANFMHNTQLHRYFEMYAKNFDLLRYIKFKHTVQQVKRSPDYATTGKWTVDYITADGEEKSEEFDGVLLCTGHHALPYSPSEWPGQSEFKGRVLHAHSYKDWRGYEDQIVAIVGVGNSGGDIAVELARIAKQVYLTTRRGTWVFNRVFDYGQPFDMVLSRRVVFWAKEHVPPALSNWVAERRLQRRFDHNKFGLQPKHRVFNAHPTVNDDLPNRIANGTVRVKPNIRRFTENGLEFEDGTKVEHVDAVVLATGYSFEFDILENGELVPVVENDCDLYKYMFPVATADKNTLAIVGLTQPYGSIMPISEMQARVFFDQLVGNSKLPKLDVMKREIDSKRREMQGRYVHSRRHTIQVDYIPYMDELAQMIDATPSLLSLLASDPRLALAYFFGPALPYTYRLSGPHQWNGARNAILGAWERADEATRGALTRPTSNGLVVNLTIPILIVLVVYFLGFPVWPVLLALPIIALAAFILF